MRNLTVRQQVNRIQKYMEYASSTEIEQGKDWYKDARELCESIASTYPVSVKQVAEVVSILSPQKKWETNQAETIALFDEIFLGIKPNFKYFCTRRQLCRAIGVIRNEKESRLTDKYLKTFSFADNIADENSTEVTVDRHALRVAYDDQTAEIDKVGIRQYKDAREAYRKVADKYGLKPYQVQAITWVVYKRIVQR